MHRYRYALIIAVACLCLLAMPLRAATPRPPVERVTAHTVWTPTALYFGIQVDDPLVVGNQTAPMGQPWLDDAVAIYLDLDPTNGDVIDRDCLRVVVSAAGGITVQRGDKGDWRDDPSWFQPSDFGTIRVARKVDGVINDSAQPDKGFSVELALAWGLLGVQPPFLRAADDPLPAVGFAVACYSQGEMRSVSCWPEGVMEEDLEHPARWGQLVFLQNSRPQPGKERVATAPLVMLDPFIDGDVRAVEWVMSGAVSFQKRWGLGMAPLAPGRQTVALTAAWYSLFPDGLELAPGEDGGLSNHPTLSVPVHQPLEPLPPGLSSSDPLYHQLQVKVLREVGIDALAVDLPTTMGGATRPPLLALVEALEAYDVASSAHHFRDVPLLLPVIDCRNEPADPVKLAATIENALREAFRAIPPQYRLTMPLPSGERCYPVLLVAPPNPGPLAALPLAELSAKMRAEWSLPIGWLPDAAWTGDVVPPTLLARCAWDASTGVQVSAGGTLRTALIAPGVAARQGYLSRVGGDTYANGWVKLTGMQPDFVVIRSWNDFVQGSEIAASRQHGNQYLDATRLALMHMGAGRIFGLRLISATLPSVLRAGADYPVDVLVKNGSLQKLVSQSGFRVDYRVLRGEQLVIKGMATDQLALFEMATSRISFTLPTADGHRPLSPGDYRLCLDFRRNKIPFLTAPLLTEQLGTLVIPFTVATDAPRAQCVETALPARVAPGQSPPAGLQLRNMSGEIWRKGKVAVRLRWLAADGAPLPGEAVLPLRANVVPGATTVFAGQLPPAPTNPGWARLRADLLAGEMPSTPKVAGETPSSRMPGGHASVEPETMPIPDAWIAVQPAGAVAQVLAVKMPAEMTGKDVTVPVALRNAGVLPWEPATTRLAYRWLAWDGQPLEGAVGIVPLPAAVPPGETTTVNLPVTPPPGAGSFRCALSVIHRDQPATLLADPSEPAAPVYPVRVRPARWLPLDLSAAMNGVIATAEHVKEPDGIDLLGTVFPLEDYLPDCAVPPLGYQPEYYRNGANPAWPGFLFPAPKDGRAPMVRGLGQPLPLPAKTAVALHLVALNAVKTVPATFIVTYQDGTREPVTQTITCMLDEPVGKEPVMLRTRRLRSFTGDDWYLRGAAFAYRLPLSAKPLKSITLPDGGAVCVLAMTLELPDDAGQ